jgi:hypothetical protein
VMRGAVGQQWITGKRAPMSGCSLARVSPLASGRGGSDKDIADDAQRKTEDCLRRERVFYVPDETEKRSGMGLTCFSQVYIDRSLQNAGQPTMPYDISGMDVRQIEGIEWYETQSQTPAKYDARQAKCGVLIIHTLKGRGK